MERDTIPHEHGDISDLEEFRSLLSETVGFNNVANVLSQMADGTRMRIFWLLCHYEGCVTNISAIMNMSSPAVSHHLRSLKTSGLITSRRVGKEVYYKAVESNEAKYLHRMIEELMEITCPKH
ncbi:MAG: winged helix-turn-helix transcriptional regulator [Candidatus Methanomethylophilaceae archaeon]|nr:winged helix-turn-helix transcriptional regulator [Candidatus Methanomethylophilaceae archaeon]